MSDTIDITPVGLQTPEGQKRVAEAQQEWDSATHLLANVLGEFISEHSEGILKAVDYLSSVDDSQINSDAVTEDLHQLKALIGARDRKQEKFLRAVSGKPKLYPANVNGERVMVTIPED